MFTSTKTFGIKRCSAFSFLYSGNKGKGEGEEVEESETASEGTEETGTDWAETREGDGEIKEEGWEEEDDVWKEEEKKVEEEDKEEEDNWTPGGRAMCTKFLNTLKTIQVNK